MHFKTNNHLEGEKTYDDGPFEPILGVKNILVTGAAGFIGGWFARRMVKKYGEHYKVVCFDKLEYCASINNFCAIQDLTSFVFVKGDVCSQEDVNQVLRNYQIDAIVHCAAHSHVDRSFNEPVSFTETNVMGTHVLIEAARQWNRIRRFIHVSTDEVYGENNALRPSAFNEDQTLSPTNPYAASKAAAEMIIQSYFKSFRVPIIITRCNNVFGPHQYPEKLIPKFITLLEQGKKMPVHGDGHNARAFLWVGDAVEAIDTIFHRGELGESYNIASEKRLEVHEVAKKIFECFEWHSTASLENWMELVDDRPFNDTLYWTDDTKLRQLGWTPRTPFYKALEVTVEWYRYHSSGFWPDLC